MLSEETVIELREDHANADKNRSKWSLYFSLLFSVCCISLARLLTICIVFVLNYPVIYSLPKRESGRNMQGTLALARLKIVPSRHQVIVSQPQIKSITDIQ